MPPEKPADQVQLYRDEVIPALEARERFLDAILGSLEAFLAVDEDWRLTYVNGAAAERAGAAADDLLGRELWATVPDLLDEAARGSLQRAMAGRERVEFEAEDLRGEAYHARAHPLADGGLAVYVQDVSERRRRELEREQLTAALRMSEQSFAAVFEASPFAMSLTEMPSARVLRVNRAFEELLGFPRDELVGRTSPDLGITDPDSRAEVARRFEAEGVVRDLEVVRARHDGAHRILSLSLDWVTLGQERSVLTSIRDVTEQRRAEQALVASEHRYRSIVETTADGIMLGASDGTIVFVNQRMADMLGYPAGELVGMAGAQFVYPDWMPKVLENRDALAQGGVVRGEFKLRRKDGSALWTVFSSTPLHDEAGGHVGNLTMHTDISERRAAEEALRQSEERFRGVFESRVAAIALGGMDGRLVLVNQAFADLLGYTRDELVGMDVGDMTHPEDLQQELPAYEQVRAGELASYSMVKRYVRKDGSFVWADLEAGILRDAKGRPEYGIAIVRDITRRREAEAALRESEERLSLALSAGGIATWDYRIDTAEVVWNAEHFRMLGYEPGEVTPGFESFLERVHSDDADRVSAAFLGALERGEDYLAEFRALLPDGGLRWIVAEGHFELGADGRSVRSYGVMLDVTDREMTAEALRLSEERFRLVLGAAPVSVAAQDKDLRYVWAFNQRTAPSGGVLGMADADLFTPEEAARLTAIKRRVLDEGIELREQLWLDRPQGRMYLDCTFMPLRDDQGSVTGVGIATVDLTPVRLAEEARRETEESLRSFYDSVSLLMGVAELDGERIVPVSGNRAAEGLLGGRLAVTPEGASCLEGEEPTGAGGLERELVRRYRDSEVTRRPVRFEHELERGGGVRLLSFTVAHIGSGTSGRPRFSFVGEDITERRRAELLLRERDVEQAAREEKSRIARDLHDSVTQALFAASLKAEALTGMEGVSPEVESVIEEVRRLNRGALAQMRTMLLELRGDPLEGVPLQQLLRNVVEATESRTRADVSLTVEGSEQLPAAVHVTLYRVAQEALNNVARHAQADHAWVEVRLLPRHALLTVKDDGRGFELGPVSPEHIGLRSMAERAAEAGAELRIVAAPGAGTEIAVEWRAAE
jgi:PAS domain S-box-containing protein